MAECHPVAFQWVVEARARGATVIHIDPRFTRTSALADQHVPTRAGGDIVFLGALINHVLSGGHEFTRVRARLHQRRRHPAGGLHRRRGRRRPVLRLRPGYQDLRQLQLAADRRARRDADPPAMRVPGAEAALRAVHAGAGRAGLRDPASGVRQGGRRYRRSQRAGEDDRVGVRGGVDAAQHRRAAHQGRVHPADAARQHGPSRRRHPGAARAREHPGRDRRADAVPPAQRLPADAGRRRGHDQLPGPDSGHRVLGQQAQVPGQLPEGMVRGRGYGGERLLFRLSAADYR